MISILTAPLRFALEAALIVVSIYVWTCTACVAWHLVRGLWRGEWEEDR